DFKNHSSGKINLSGIFVLCAQTGQTCCCMFNETPTGELSGIPQLYSNKNEIQGVGGSWISNGQTEKWNGVECKTSGNTPEPDTSLTVIRINDYDSANVFFIYIIGGALRTQSIGEFKTAYSNSLSISKTAVSAGETIKSRIQMVIDKLNN
ncbi:MAG: hypothetical protein LBM72_01570, partial [Mycoplasmataceae bacterium]|nr:hypothetical protein [Mycoplasmataceae bacterium]